MAGKASRDKGSNGERELAKILGGIFGGSFIRTPGSGGYVGGKNFTRKARLSASQTRTAKGDLVPPDGMPKLVIEAKSYGRFGFHQLLTSSRCPQLDDWIAQTLTSIDSKDAWFVCFKINRLGWFIVVPEQDQGYRFGNHCLYRGAHGIVQVTDMLEFFKNNRDLVAKLSA